MSNHEENVNALLLIISELISLPKGGNVKDIDELIKVNVEHIKSSNGYKKLEAEIIRKSCNNNSTERWKFTCICLDALKQLNVILMTASNDKERLLSVSQQKLLHSCTELVVCLGILPHLIDGVAPLPEYRSKNWKLLEPENIDALEKYRRLKYTTDCLLQLYHGRILSNFIIPPHLVDLLAALCQLCFAPLKKPLSPSSKDLVQISCKESFVMTDEYWQELQNDRKYFKIEMDKLIKRLYQPLVIKNLMMLQSNKKVPRWERRELCRILAECLIREGGVEATVLAVCDSDSNYLNQWQKLDNLVTLFNGVYTMSEVQYKNHIVPQIKEMLRAERNNAYGEMYCRLAVLTIKSMYTTNNEFANKCYLNAMMEPLKRSTCALSESELGAIINDLYICFALPGNDLWSLPCNLLCPIVHTLFRVHCHIEDGISYLKNPIKDILLKFFTTVNIKTDLIETVFDLLLFHRFINDDDFSLFPASLKIVNGPSGGIVFTENLNNRSDYDTKSFEQTAASLTKLVVACSDTLSTTNDNDNVDSLISRYFVHLLKSFQQFAKESNDDDDIERAEKLLVIVNTLNAIISEEKWHNDLLRHPQPVIAFVGELLNNYNKSSSNENQEDSSSTDVICICLLFLSSVLENVQRLNRVDWSWFENIVEPVKLMKDRVDNENLSVKVLAEEVYNRIVTRNVIASVVTNNNGERKPPKKDSTPSESIFKSAMKDACDELLPVRAHGLMVLIDLLKKNDSEAKSKSDILFCLFKENLKHEDSYLYLKAIEGLAVLAAFKPDKILPIICDEYSNSSHDPEVRLKVGETLIRLVGKLGDFIYKYKALLLNTFLSGTDDADHLVRASSLSNLAEVAYLLNNKLGTITIDVFSRIKYILDHDLAPEPRRAAVLVITLLLKGLSTDMLNVLEEFMSELYKTLKRVYYSDKDENVRLHAQIALDQLKQNTVDFFSKKPISYSKKIYVLDPPTS